MAETVSESEADPISRDAKAQSKYKGKPSHTLQLKQKHCIHCWAENFKRLPFVLCMAQQLQGSI